MQNAFIRRSFNGRLFFTLCISCYFYKKTRLNPNYKQWINI